MTLILVLVAVLFAGCSANAPAGPETVTIAVEQPPLNLDPRIGTDYVAQRIFQLTFSGLVKKNDRSSVDPDLALSWEVPDPTTYIFHLRKDAKFHDGRSVTARDVVYTFRTILDGSVRTAKIGTYRVIESVDAPDDYTVVFKLKEPFSPFLYNLARGGFGVIPEGSGPDFGRHPIGSGEFAVVHYIQDSEVMLRRNDDYYGEKPHIQHVRIKIIPEAIVMALELRKGTVDIALNVLPPDIVEALRRDDNLEVRESTGTRYQYMAFNLKDPVFRDVRVRKAIAHAIDREKILKYLWRNQAEPAASVIPPNNWAYAPDVATYPYDPERARSLLREAGQGHLSFTFSTSTEETQRMLASVLQQQLREVGIEMRIRSNEFATFYNDIISGNFQAYSLRWIGGNTDPDIFDLIFNSTRTPPNGANRGFYSNPEVDRLVGIARREMDMEIRKQAYRRVQQIVAEELPYVNLWFLDNVCVYSKRIGGLRLYPDGELNFLAEIRTVPVPTASGHTPSNR
jgi:peptide/nickel transport system substrate-binding protein